MNIKQERKIKKDLLLVAFSVLVGIIILKSGFVEGILNASVEVEYLGIFLAGMFFTSVFTTVPATLVLGELALRVNLPILAIIGGLGALLGDFIIFRFFKDTITEDLEVLFKIKSTKRFKHLFKSTLFRWFLTLVGGLIIASPLPDELGLALMGFSKTNNKTFAVVSLLCNSLGIIIIGLAARSIAAAI